MNRSCCFSIIALAMLAIPAAQAQYCTESQFTGVYSALAKGEFLSGIPVPPQLLGPTTRIGRVEVDGAGRSKLRAITSLNGVVVPEEYGGTYTVNPDCTTSTTLNIPFPGVPGTIPFTFTGVLSNNFQQLDMILVNPPGSTIIISLRQQNRGSCAVSDLNGGYTIEMRGTTGLPAGPAVPFARLGRVLFDGQGGFSTQTTVSNGGKLNSDNFSGSYTVQSSCEFTMNYGGGNTWAGVLMDKSTAANLMVTGPTVFPPGIPFPVAGLVVSGTLRKQ